MADYELQYAGKARTPDGVVDIYDTGKRATPVELAESLAFQHSVFTGNHRSRQEARRRIFEWTQVFARRVGLCGIDADGKQASFWIAEDGRVVTTVPVVSDMPEAKR